MPLPRRALLGASMLGAGLALPALQARGQAWPNRPIRIVVPSVTGGFDNYARMMTPRLSEILGVPVVVENKPGANGNVGMQEVQRAAPDGHTILFAAIGSLSINVSVYRGMPLDPVEDLAAVACPVTSPMVWVANPESGPRSLGELVERARAAPGKLDYALPSAGTINHLIVEGFKLRHGLDIPAVPYRGTPPAQLDVVAGRVPVMVDSLGAGWGHINGGRLRALAVTSRERSPRAPEVPTAIELGLDETDYVAWYAYMAPKATPPELVAKLNAAINRVALEEAYVTRLAEMGAGTQAMTPAAQLAFMLAERKKWGDIARAAKVEVV
jgi:tripartite-type tricarboxylate transporter receptor subunit TctC